jgi:hypothetical protein
MSAQAPADWPDLVQLHCRFSDVFTVARREETWEVISDLRAPQRSISLAFNTDSGARSVWGVRDREPYRNGATIQHNPHSLSITHPDTDVYDWEPPPGQCRQGEVLGCDEQRAFGNRTYTWFGTPDEQEGMMVITFVSDRLVTTDTGVCRRIPMDTWAQQTHPSQE